MTLIVPKSLAIRNLKVSVLYHALQILVLGGLIVLNWSQQSYMLKVNIGSQVTKSWWVPVEEELSGKVRAARQEAEFCTNPSKFKYWFSASYKYENHTCMLLCDLLNNHTSMEERHEFADCLEAEETMNDGQESIFIDTSLRSTNPQTGETKNYFIPTADAHKIQFFYQFYAEDKRSWPFYQGKITRASSSTDILTVIIKRDSSGKLEKDAYRIEKPAKRIELTVPEILNLAGVPTYLDEPHLEAGVNIHPGAPLPGPTGRQIGIQLIAIVDCYNSGIMHGMMLSKRVQDWPLDKICYLTFKKEDVPWVLYRRQRENKRKEDFEETVHGMRIVFKSDSEFHYESLFFMLNVVVSISVLMKLPDALMKIFVFNALGVTSRMYHQNAIENFSLKRAMACLTARMLAYSRVFHMLSEGAVKINKLVLEDALRNALGAAFGGDGAGLRNFCRFSVDSITMDRRAEVDASESSIHEDTFIDACISQEIVPPRCLHQLFDPNTRLGIVEKVFLEHGVEAGRRHTNEDHTSVENAGRLGKIEDSDQRAVTSSLQETVAALAKEVAVLKGTVAAFQKELAQRPAVQDLRVRPVSEWDDRQLPNDPDKDTFTFTWADILRQMENMCKESQMKMHDEVDKIQFQLNKHVEVLRVLSSQYLSMGAVPSSSPQEVQESRRAARDFSVNSRANYGLREFGEFDGNHAIAPLGANEDQSPNLGNDCTDQYLATFGASGSKRSPDFAETRVKSMRPQPESLVIPVILPMREVCERVV